MIGHRNVAAFGTAPLTALPMNFPRGLALWASVFLSTLPVHAINYRMESSATWAENITHSSAPSDWRDAHRLDMHLAGGVLQQWAAGLVTTTELDAGFERVPKYTRLDAFGGGVSTQVRQKFGFGPFAPVVSVDLGLHGRDAKIDGDDGWIASGSLRLAKRLAPAWRVAVIGDWQQHYARSSIFDTRHHRFFGTVAWDITPWLQLSHGNGRLWGDITANASPGIWARALAGDLGRNISDYYNTVSWGATDSVGPGWVTYRVTSRVSFWWLELSPAIGRNTSLPLRYESHFSVNKVGVKYVQDSWSIQVLHRF